MRSSNLGTELDTTLTPAWGTFTISTQAHHPLRALCTSASLPAHPQVRTGQFSVQGRALTPVPSTRNRERFPALRSLRRRTHTARASHRSCP